MFKFLHLFQFIENRADVKTFSLTIVLLISLGFASVYQVKEFTKNNSVVLIPR